MVKYCSISPYAYCSNSPIKFIYPDGKCIDFPPTNTTYWQQEALSQKVDETIKNNPSTIRANAMTEMARASDLNDAVVLGTAITRGSQAVNVDGTYATVVDKGFL